MSVVGYANPAQIVGLDLLDVQIGTSKVRGLVAELPDLTKMQKANISNRQRQKNIL